MKNLTRILMPLFLLFGSPTYLSAKTRVSLEIKCGKGCYETNGPKTSLEFKARKYFFLKYQISLSADSDNRTYSEEGKEYKVPEGNLDILTALRQKAESHYQGNRTDTFDIFVNKKLMPVVIRDRYLYDQEERVIGAWPLVDNEFGKGIQKIRFHLEKNEDGSLNSIPKRIVIKHKEFSGPIILYSKKVEDTEDGN